MNKLLNNLYLLRGLADSNSSMLELLESDPNLSIHVYPELSEFLWSHLRLTTLNPRYERGKNLGFLYAQEKLALFGPGIHRGNLSRK